MTGTVTSYRQLLKGGSLCGTYEMRVGELHFIRKEISLLENREFGLQRWYSQLKRLQSYDHLFPGLFPPVLDFAVEGDKAYFDLEYIEDSLTIHEYLCAERKHSEISDVFNRLMESLSILHQHPLRAISSRRPLDLYLYEEVERRISMCQSDPAFRSFASHRTISFNGERVPGLAHQIPEFLSLMRDNYTTTDEAFTHGNVTLENVLYVPATQRIVLIDPYGETYVDSILGEYSQILQSCNSLYELYNAAPLEVRNEEITVRIPHHPAIHSFNALFHDFLKQRLSRSQFLVLGGFEISQFIRMLPFKMAIAPQKMSLFYGLASLLFERLRREHHLDCTGATN